MKFTVYGIENKEKIALTKLIKAFDRTNELVKDGIEIYVTTKIDDNSIHVKLKTNDFETTNQTSIINTIAYDKKYLILVCFYQYLVKITGKKLRYGVLTGIRPTKLVQSYYNRLPENELRAFLNKKFMIAYGKCDLLISIVKKEENIINKYTNISKEVSIYINIPFCLSRCSYCSFSSYPQNYHHVSRRDYINTLIEEIKGMGHYLKNNGVCISSIYIGGGTPTALTNDELKDLLDEIENDLLFNPVKEYTLECGRPDSFDEEKLKLIRNYSVSRISINPQTFNNETLQRVNRNHTTGDIINKFNLARKLGFNDINMDLIIGLPNETLADFKYSIDQTILLLPESITIHYLAQKKGSKLYNKNLTEKQDEYYKAFDYAIERLNNNGYNPYYLYRQKNIAGNLENVGYSKKGYESLYNILMIEEKQNIIGLGSQASSKFLNYEIILNPKDLISYMKSSQDYFRKKIKILDEVLERCEV